MMIDLTIQINFMYKHNVTDLICIGFLFRRMGAKKTPKNEKTEYEIPPLQA